MQEYDIILDTDPIKLTHERNKRVAVMPGTYTYFRFRRLHNVEVHFLGPCHFTSTEETNNIRNVTNLSLFGNAAPSEPPLVTLAQRVRIFDMLADGDYNTSGVTIRGLEIAFASSGPALQITPKKSLDGHISNVSIEDCTVGGVNEGFYLGSPNYVSEYDHTGVVSGLRVVRNRLFGASIRIKGQLKGDMSLIRHNHVEGAALENQSGIAVLAGGGGANILDNHILYSRESGVHSSLAVKGHVNVKRNIILHSGKNGAHIRSDSSELSDNTIIGTGEHCIDISGRAENALVHDNTAFGQGLGYEAIKRGGSPDENFYNNHTVFMEPDYFTLPYKPIPIPPPPPQPEPRFWNVSFALADDGETLTASPVEIEETERTNERIP